MEHVVADMRIRPAEAADVPQIVLLWREMWEYHRRLDSRYEVTPYADRVMEAWVAEHLERDRSRVLVAESASGLQGYGLAILMDNPPVVPQTVFGYVSELAVTAEARRHGVGGMLVEEMHRWFRAMNCSYVEANVSVFNAVSRGFWRKQGYREFLERLRYELTGTEVREG
jgi:ribosomal protein S18 acetylase RimI-like enzyme